MKKINTIDSYIPNAGLLKADQVERILESQDVYVKVKAWEKKVRKDVKAELREIKKKAVSDGYQDAISNLTGAVQDSLDKLDHREDRFIHDLKSCLTKALKETPPINYIKGLVLPILESFDSDENITLHVHDSQIEIVRSALAKVFREKGLDRIIQILSDEDIDENDVIIFTSGKIFDVSVSTVVEGLLYSIDVQK